MEKQKFHQTFSKLLDVKLQPMIDKGRTLNLTTCIEFYTTIFDTLVECITAACISLTNEAMNYIAQQYYDSIMINGNQELNPNIFTQRSKVENVETKELALLAVMLNGTDFAFEIINEIKKRQ